MKKRNIFTFALLVIFSASQFVYANDVWVVPTSVKDFYGTWECSMAMSAAAITQGALPNSTIDLRIIFEYAERSSIFSATFHMDMDSLLDDMLNMPELKALGLTKDAIWRMMFPDTSVFEEEVDGYLMTIDRYYIRLVINETFDEATLLSTSQGSIFFNPARNRMRLSLDNSNRALDIFPGITDEIILTKR